MKVFLAGSGDLGANVAEALIAAGHEISVVSPAPGRRLKDPLYKYASKMRIPMVSDYSAFTAGDVPDDTDLMLTVFSRWMVPMPAVEKCRYGGVGLHPSILPKHRGSDAVYWTWKMREPVGGWTVYRLEQKCDTGAIVAQVPVALDQNAKSHVDVWNALVPYAPQLVVDAVDAVERGFYGVEQDELIATFEPNHKAQPVQRRGLIPLPPAGGSSYVG